MRKYIIVSIDELDKVDFDFILEDKTTLLYFIKNDTNEIFTSLKWTGEDPYFLNDIQYMGIYNEEQIVSVIESDFIESNF
jgi:hypothetical protein